MLCITYSVDAIAIMAGGLTPHTPKFVDCFDFGFGFQRKRDNSTTNNCLLMNNYNVWIWFDFIGATLVQITGLLIGYLMVKLMDY